MLFQRRGNYSKWDIFQGRTLFKEIRYSIFQSKFDKTPQLKRTHIPVAKEFTNIEVWLRRLYFIYITHITHIACFQYKLPILKPIDRYFTIHNVLIHLLVK